jgi:hypothetical protein
MISALIMPRFVSFPPGTHKIVKPVIAITIISAGIVNFLLIKG